MEWFFPDDLSDTLKLLKKGYILHSGGTGILMGDIKRIKGLISLDKLNLNYVKKEKNKIIIGATATFSDVIKNLKKIEPENILVKAISKAASTPLRNRITIGGSIAFAPLWSDILGPLIALECKVKVIGENKGEYKISEFIKSPEIKKYSMIKEISFDRGTKKSAYFTFKRTSFDFSIFNISLVLKDKSLRIALWGTKDKEKRLIELEEFLKKNDKFDEDDLRRFFKPEFHNNIYFSKEYLQELARIQLLRMLNEIYGR